MVYHADYVELTADTNYGEGWVIFRWPDPLFGWDCLIIDLDGHCSRRMPIRSGGGPPDFVELQRDRIHLHFEAALAKKLELEQDVEITFSLTDDEFRQLSAVVRYFEGEEDTES